MYKLRQTAALVKSLVYHIVSNDDQLRQTPAKASMFGSCLVVNEVDSWGENPRWPAPYSMRDWNHRAPAPASNAAVSRTGKHWSKVRCISAGSVGRASQPGAGCCGAISATGKYRTTTLGLADDAAKADGARVLTFEQAEAKARVMVETPNGKFERLTVRQAFDRYIAYKRALGQSVKDVLSRGSAHILPPLGDLVVAELTAEQLRKWLATLAAQPAQTRPKAGKPQFQRAPTTDKEIARAAPAPIAC